VEIIDVERMADKEADHLAELLMILEEFGSRKPPLDRSVPPAMSRESRATESQI
jgi:hypothetical protein